MDEITNRPATAIKGEDHWTTKDGNVRLFLFEKCAGDPKSTTGTILFVHGSSMAAQPTFDLQVEGRPDSSAMDWFARRGFDCWSVDMEGYGRSTKDRDNNAPIAQGADDCFAAASYIQKLRGKRPFLVYGISSGALRAALFAERHPELVGRLALDAMVWTGEGSPTLAERKKKLARISRQEPPTDRQGVHPFDLRPRPSRHRGRESHRRLCRSGHRARHLGADRNLCRYVQQSAGGRSGKDHGADADHARPVGRHCRLRRPASNSSPSWRTRTSTLP